MTFGIKIREIKLIKICPVCGSGDVHFCYISQRPYCNECKHWERSHFEHKSKAISRWNNRVRKSGYIE